MVEVGSQQLQDDDPVAITKTLGPRSVNVAGLRSLALDFRDVGAGVAP